MVYLFYILANSLWQLFESEMRCAMVEAQVREEVIQEMGGQMQNMEKVFTRRLMKEVCHTFGFELHEL